MSPDPKSEIEKMDAETLGHFRARAALLESCIASLLDHYWNHPDASLKFCVHLSSFFIACDIPGHPRLEQTEK